MSRVLPTDWEQLSLASFRWPLDLTQEFHDAGFFDYRILEKHLDITIHPIYFGKENNYSYNDLNACKLLLSTNSDISKRNLDLALEAFGIFRLNLTETDIKFCFAGYTLNIMIRMKDCRFKFISIPDGEDYWSGGI